MPALWPTPSDWSTQSRFLDLKNLFSTRRVFLVLGLLVLVLALVLALILVPPYLQSLGQGTVDNVQMNILVDNPGQLDTSQEYPKTWEVEIAMEQVKNKFQVEFRHCDLESLTYDKAYSDQLRPQLTELYKDQLYGENVFLITAAFTTGDKEAPQGLEPNTTYEDYQWVIGDAKDAHSNISIVDHGFLL